MAYTTENVRDLLRLQARAARASREIDAAMEFAPQVDVDTARLSEALGEIDRARTSIRRAVTLLDDEAARIQSYVEDSG